MKQYLIVSVLVFSTFNQLSYAADAPAPPSTIDEITNAANQPVLAQILGPMKTIFLAGKSVACAIPADAPMTEAQAEQALSKYPVKSSQFRLDLLGKPVFVLTDATNESYDVGVGGMGISIEQGPKHLLSEISVAKNDCSLGYVTRHVFTDDGRPLMDLMPGENGVREQDYNTPPKSLEALYGSNGYDSKSLQHLEAINADPSRVGVAVIDIGVDYNDPVFSYKIDRKEVGLDLVENDYIPCDMGGDGPLLIGDDGHGTSVSDLAVAGSDKLSLIPIRHDVRSKASGDVPAIEYAAKRGARVVNMSFGYMGSNETQDDLMKVCSAIRAHSEIVFVAAADDSANDNDAKPIYPASCQAPNLISVGSVNFLSRKSDFSGFGKKTIQIAAKGENLNLDIGYGFKKKESGTSFAAPQVANVAGKILVINPKLTSTEVIQILTDSASKHSSLEQYFSSSGVLNEGKALEMANKSLKSSK